MLHRTLSTLALWTIVFCALYFGGMWGGAALLVALSVLAQREYYVLREATGVRPRKGVGIALGLVWMGAVASAALHLWAAILVFLLVFFAWTSVLFLLRPPSKENLSSVMETLFGVFYVPFLMSFYILLMMLPFGNLWLSVLVVAMAKFADMGGLLVGKTFGRHKIAPVISPKKSWEGLFGSVVFSMLVMLIAYYLPQWCEGAVRWEFLMPLSAWLVLSAILAVVSLVSDLTESAFKRVADKKDSGAIIPGIGGALDLCDSLLFTAPVAFVCILLWMTIPRFN